MVLIKTQIIGLLLGHFIADFVLQSDNIALNKSKDNHILGAHCIIYGLIMMIVSLNVMFGFLVGLIHFGVDYYTSRWTAKLWSQGDRHNFFVVIGLDQFIHIATIIILI